MDSSDWQLLLIVLYWPMLFLVGILSLVGATTLAWCVILFIVTLMS